MRVCKRYFSLFLCCFFSYVSYVAAEPFAYVGNLFSHNVSVIDTSTNTVVNTMSVGNGPIAIATTPNGAFAYVCNFNGNNVSVINTALQ
jgi:YVTN family beta-propeller protein